MRHVIIISPVVKHKTFNIEPQVYKEATPKGDFSIFQPGSYIISCLYISFSLNTAWGKRVNMGK